MALGLVMVLGVKAVAVAETAAAAGSTEAWELAAAGWAVD